MNRRNVLSISLSVSAAVLGLMLAAVPVAAQRPGRQTPAATFDRSSINAARTPLATPNAPQATRQRPNAGTPVATFSIPLNLTLTPRGTFALPESSDEAAAVINSFAAAYVGTTYDFVYAGSLDGEADSTNWDAYVAQLPENVQSYIAAFSTAAGGSYWGVFKNGIGMTAVGDCTNNPNCTVSMDNLNVYLNSASSGVYGVYVAGGATNAGDALNLIRAVFPGLSAVALEAVTSQQGYTFEAVTYASGTSNKQVTASTHIYVAGIIPGGTQSLVYAVVGVGDGYVGMVQ